MTTWTKVCKGTYRTTDGRWTAGARWDSIKGEHWVLIIGDSFGPVLWTEKTLKALKRLVDLPGWTDERIAREEQWFAAQLVRLQGDLDAAQVYPSSQDYIRRGIQGKIDQLNTNWARFTEAVEAQGAAS
jgi:hypothetical protein